MVWTLDVPGMSQEQADGNILSVQKLAGRLTADPVLRAMVEEDASDLLRDEGMFLPQGMQVRVHIDTATLMHVVMPPDPNAELSDERLEIVVGGVGTAATMSTSGQPSGACMTSVQTIGSYSSV